MSGAKEIRTKIKSIQNTQKITKAMEMVAASKMRRAQERMNQARPYAEKMANVMAHLAQANLEYKHSYTESRDPKRVGFIVVSSDRGLCGGLNINLFRQALGEFRAAKDAGAEVDLMIVGSKGMSFFKRVGGNIVSEITGLGDTPHLDQLIGPVKVLLDKYRDGELDKVLLIHNRFVNTMTQAPTVEQLLPVQPVQDEGLLDNWDYIYEPSAEDLLDGILMRYVESQVYGAVAENVACEMAARMIAMKSASDNAGQIIEDLQLEYNKARQAAITQELAEIVGGAAAV